MSIVYVAPAATPAAPSVHQKPSTADPEDEEFDGSSVPSGFGLIRYDTGAALSASVGVDPWTVNAAIANPVQWQTGYRRSMLSVQTPYRGGTTNPEIWLYRPLVAPITLSTVGSNPQTTPLCFRSRVQFATPLWQQVTQGGQGTFMFGLAKDNGAGKPDPLNYVAAMAVIYPGNSAASLRYRSRWAGVNSGNAQDFVNQTLPDYGRGFANVQHFVVAISKQRYMFVGIGDENVHYLGNNSGEPAQGFSVPATFSHLFWHLSWDGGSGVNNPSGAVHIDYVRKSLVLP